MKNKSCKFAIVAAAAVVLLTGCGSDERKEKPVMQTGTAGTNATTSVVTTMPTTAPTMVPTVAPTTVPATITSTLPSVPVAPTSPSGEVTLTTSAPTTVPTTAQTTVPTTVTTQPEHECAFTWIEVDATCTANGYTSMECACGKTVRIVTSNPLGHKYGEWTSNNDATCVKDGTKTRKCQRCGEPDVKADEGSALGHDLKITSDVPSDYYGPGWTVKRCKNCSYYENNYKDPWTQEQKDAFCREVEALIIEQLNAYRIAEGTAPATHLPGMQQVAIYRAWQVKDKELAHDWDQLTEACTVYKYGLPCYDVTVDETTGAYIQGELNGTYIINGLEALARVTGLCGNTPEAISRAISAGLYESKDHWNYLGDAEFPYIAAGITFEPMVGWSCCVLVSSDNHDLQNNA